MLPASHRELIEREHEEQQRKLAARPSQGRAVEAILPTLAAISIGGAALALYAQRSHRRGGDVRGRRLNAGIGVLGLTAGFGLARWQLARLFTQQPRYELERRTRALEVRRYPACIEASTIVEHAEWREALDRGFRRLAKYLFGENEAGERIEMTAPVLIESDTELDEPGRVRVAVLLPRGRPIHAFPRPKDERVNIGVRQRRRLAAISFGGSLDPALIGRKEHELVLRARGLGLVTKGRPLFAGYDAPSTLPILRRNEVWIELAAGS